MTALSLKNITVNLGRRSFLKDLNLDLNNGELIAIVGPNGAGKSTLLKAISGDQPCAQGHILFHGKPLHKLAANKRAQNIAVLPQHNSLNFSFSAQQVVALGRIPHDTGLRQDNQFVTEAMAAMDISHLAERLYTHLSGGEKQRVQLARVLAQIWQVSKHFPSRLLLLDEPTAHLDLGHQQQLMSVIKQFTRQSVTVLCVLHDINLAIRYADTLIAMSHGKIEAIGPPENIVTQAMIEKLIGKNIQVIQLPDDTRPIVLPA